MRTGKIHEYEYAFIPSKTVSELTLLLLHGTGGNEQSLLELGSRIASQANLLSPLGNVQEGSYHRFFARVSEGVFDEEEIKTRAKELHEFIITATETHRLHATKLVAVGFSNGANIATALLQLYPSVLSGAVLLRAMPIFHTPPSTPLAGVPVLLGSGLHDALIPPTAARTLSNTLLQAGANITHVWQDADHNLTPADQSEAKNWITTNF